VNGTTTCAGVAAGATIVEVEPTLIVSLAEKSVPGLVNRIVSVPAAVPALQSPDCVRTFVTIPVAPEVAPVTESSIAGSEPAWLLPAVKTIVAC